jgi:hypothetical protein
MKGTTVVRLEPFMRIEKFLPEIIEEQKYNTEKESDKREMICDRLTYVLSEAALENNKVTRLLNIDLVSRMFQKQKTYSKIVEEFLKDFSTKAFFIAHAHWKINGKKLFKISEDFFSVFKSVSLGGIQTDALPKNVCGYCELPSVLKDDQGDTINGFYFFVGRGYEYLGHESHENWRKNMKGMDANEGDNVLALAWRCNNSDFFGYATQTFHGHESLKDIFKNSVYTERHKLGAGQYKQSVVDDGFKEHIRVMCNLLIYLNSGNPDLRSYRNTITYQSPTSQTPVRKDKALSQSEITIVGFGYKKNPIYTKEYYVQPPYWAHRWIGEGRTEKKYMLVKGSLKKRSGDLMQNEIEVKSIENG